MPCKSHDSKPFEPKPFDPISLRRRASSLRTTARPIGLFSSLKLELSVLIVIATAIAFVAPILVTVLAVIFLKEKVETGRWVAIACAFGGVLVIIRPGSEVFTWAALLPLINAAFFAGYQVLTRAAAGSRPRPPPGCRPPVSSTWRSSAWPASWAWSAT